MYRICDNVEIVETEKETIVIWEGKKVFSMNTTAIDILSFLKFPKTIDEVIDAMVEKYGDDQCVKDGVRLCVCDGKCERSSRPLSCMIFPFFPYVTQEGRIRVIPDIRGGSICPVVRNFADVRLDRRFLRRVKKIGRLLSEDEECRVFLEGISREMDVYFSLLDK